MVNIDLILFLDRSEAVLSHANTWSDADFFSGYMTSAYMEEQKRKRRKAFRKVIGLGLGTAGTACALVGMPWFVGAGFWGLGIVLWRFYKIL
jgi:hypothetical protein